MGQKSAPRPGIEGASRERLGDPVHLEEIRAQFLLRQAGDDRDQVTGAGHPVLGGERRAVVEQVTDLAALLAVHGGDPEEQREPADGLGPR